MEEGFSEGENVSLYHVEVKWIRTIILKVKFWWFQIKFL